MAAVAQPVTAIAQPMYSQTIVGQSVGTSPAVGLSPFDALNQAITFGEVAKPTSAMEFYERYCKMSGQVAPPAVATTASLAPPPQQAMRPHVVEQVAPSLSYIPPSAPYFVETVQQVAPTAYVEQPVSEYIMAEQFRGVMAEQMQTYSYLPPCIEPKAAPVMAAPVMAAPVMAAPVMAAPAMYTAPAPTVAFAQMAQNQPESVILDEIGDWLICEDAMGLFYHHTPTAQSHDQPPMELVQYYERQGVQLAPTGVFTAQAMMQPPMPQMAYTGAQIFPDGAFY
jgi:hypothetical protein